MTPLSTPAIAEITREIAPPNEAWREQARRHLDILTKPIGSLGRLEDLAAQVVAIRQERCVEPLSKAVYIFAADHGITAEGVSAYPREVTHQMVLNFLSQGAAINVLARLHHVDLSVVDVGVDADLDSVPGLTHRKVAKGTANMLREAAMTDGQLSCALAIGAALANEAAAAGHNIIAIGEMGIGNTTSASAITCALTGAAANLTTGRGTGITNEAYARKVDIVREIVEKHFGAPALPPPPLEILRCVGGFEIAAMAGMVLAAAHLRLIVVADGFISTAAAALAVAIEPTVQGYLIAGHRSQETGHKLLLDRMGLEPVLALDMRLGEGTGALLAMPIIESALCLYTQMATFASAGVSGASL